MKFRIMILHILLTALTLTACSSRGSTNEIPGRWRDSGVPALEMEFTEAGTFGEYFSDQLIFGGTYEIEGDTLLLSYTPPCGNGDDPVPLRWESLSKGSR